MSKHTPIDPMVSKRGRVRWLSPAAYEALSPAERTQLWRERKVARPVKRRFKRGGAKEGMGLGPWLAAAIAVGLGIGAFGSDLPGVLQSEKSPVTATPAYEPGEAIHDAGLPRASGARNDVVRANPSTRSGQAFGYCHVGGGTNCVVDGDTFYIGGQKVRIAGIDTPETHPPRCAHEAQLGSQATDKLHALLNSGAVTMTRIERDRDTYGRLLRNVAVDGADVGEAMISAGVAREYVRGRRGWC